MKATVFFSPKRPLFISNNCIFLAPRQKSMEVQDQVGRAQIAYFLPHPLDLYVSVLVVRGWRLGLVIGLVCIGIFYPLWCVYGQTIYQLCRVSLSFSIRTIGSYSFIRVQSAPSQLRSTSPHEAQGAYLHPSPFLLSFCF